MEPDKEQNAKGKGQREKGKGKREKGKDEERKPLKTQNTLKLSGFL